jgi:hypothetical protein
LVIRASCRGVDSAPSAFARVVATRARGVSQR